MTTTNNWSFVRYVGDGVTDTFALTVSGADIGYLRTEDMRGYVDDVLVDTTIEVATPHLIRFLTVPPVGSDVLIRREMPIDEPYADFSRGNIFSQRAVNSSFLQMLYLIQEMLDGFYPDGFYFKQDLNMGGNLIKNLGDAVDTTDAVSKKFTDALQAYADALAARIATLETTFGPDTSFLSVSFTATEGQTDFVLPVTTTGAFCIKNGAFLNRVAGDYSIVSGSTVRMSEPQEAGAVLHILAGIGEMSLWVNGIKSPNGTTWYPVMSDTGVLTWVP